RIAGGALGGREAPHSWRKSLPLGRAFDMGQAPQLYPRCSPARASQTVQERDQLAPLRDREPELEALVIEVDQLQQRRRRPVMEIGRAAGETAQDRSFEAVEITAFAGDQRSARIARVEGLGLPGVERVGATG